MTRPDATLDQLRTLIDLANERHLHDAEQRLRERVEAAEGRMGVRPVCEHGKTGWHEIILSGNAAIGCPGPAEDGA